MAGYRAIKITGRVQKMYIASFYRKVRSPPYVILLLPYSQTDKSNLL